jgi:hypothetical protein
MGYATSTIKSIQRGTIQGNVSATSWTATVSSVDLDKSVLFNGGSRSELANSMALTTMVLTNATTVTMTCGSQPTNYSLNTTYTLVEYY